MTVLAALMCAVLGFVLALAFDGWALVVPLLLAVLGLWLLGGRGERWLARRR